MEAFQRLGRLNPANEINNVPLNDIEIIDLTRDNEAEGRAMRVPRAPQARASARAPPRAPAAEALGIVMEPAVERPPEHAEDLNAYIPLEMIPPPPEHVNQWGVIRCFTPKPQDDYFNNIMSNEVSSSSSAVLPNGEGTSKSVMDIDNVTNMHGRGNEPENAVSTSGIAMDQENQPSGLHHLVARHNRGNSMIVGRYRGRQDKVKMNLMKLIARAPGGILGRDLYKKYRKRYGELLRYNNREPRSLLLMILELNLRVLVTRPFGETGDILLTVAPPGALGPVDLTGVGNDSILPEDCLQWGEAIPGTSRPAYRPGQLLLATISAIVNPSDFYIVKYGAKNHAPLERICGEMMEYYEGDGVHLVIPRCAIRVGLFCSLVDSGFWHRARITEIIDGNHVMVRHVDYGTENKVHIRELRPILRKWAELPIQAIRARLDSVGPPAHRGHQWPRESIEAFEALVFNKALFVHIMAIEERANPIVDVAIIDSSGSEDTWIDIELVKSGMADELRAGPRRLHRRVA